MTKDLDHRLVYYRSTLPFEIDVIHTVERDDAGIVEKSIVDLFKKYRWRENKSEWFQLNETQVNKMIQIMNDDTNAV